MFSQSTTHLASVSLKRIHHCKYNKVLLLSLKQHSHHCYSLLRKLAMFNSRYIRPGIHIHPNCQRPVLQLPGWYYSQLCIDFPIWTVQYKCINLELLALFRLKIDHSNNRKRSYIRLHSKHSFPSKCILQLILIKGLLLFTHQYNSPHIYWFACSRKNFIHINIRQ